MGLCKKKVFLHRLAVGRKRVNKDVKAQRIDYTEKLLCYDKIYFFSNQKCFEKIIALKQVFIENELIKKLLRLK